MRLPFPLLWPLGAALTVAALMAMPWRAPGDPAVPPTPESMSVRLADGFDFPVGKPNATGYHKARGMTPNGHLGDDWDGDGGGNTDLGDPVYACGTGVVVLAGNMLMGWGNVIMVRHTFREPAENNTIKVADSLYGHLDSILVTPGQTVGRGQQIGTIGTAFGLYEAHLHFEVRKNINIGMYRSMFARDYTNYYDPTEFVNDHRQLRAGGSAMVAMNTFRPVPGVPGAGGLSPADGAYEMGINRSPAAVASMQSSHLNKSAFSIKPHASGDAAFDKINESFRVDRYGDMYRHNDEH